MDLVQGMDESKLLKACRQGDRRAQEILYRRHYGRMMGVAMRYARDRDEAAEILNQSFFKVFQRLDRYDPNKGKLEAWIYRITMNSAIDHYRSKIRPMRSEPIENVRDKGHHPTIVEELAAEEILALIKELSPAYRAVFTLYVVEGYTHPEVAKKLGISEGTSKSNLAKARKKMQKLLLTLKRPESSSRYAR
jgi:RNA polymerase sigma-70 factor (ECF subfamily)